MLSRTSAGVVSCRLMISRMEEQNVRFKPVDFRKALGFAKAVVASGINDSEDEKLGRSQSWHASALAKLCSLTLLYAASSDSV